MSRGRGSLQGGRWGRGALGGGCPRRGRAAAGGARGNDAPAEIGLRLLAGEHEWGLGKPAKGSVEAMGANGYCPRQSVLHRRGAASSGSNWSSGCARQGQKGANGVTMIS
jgi:hypothetical protein